jgi:hypothetical protein
MEKTERIVNSIVHALWLASAGIVTLTIVWGLQPMPEWLSMLGWISFILISGMEVCYFATGRCGGKIGAWVCWFNAHLARKCLFGIIGLFAVITVAGFLVPNLVSDIVHHLSMHLLPLLGLIAFFDIRDDRYGHSMGYYGGYTFNDGLDDDVAAYYAWTDQGDDE